jgi:hypothetical protein
MSGEKEAAAMKAQVSKMQRAARQRSEERRAGFSGGAARATGGRGRWSDSTTMEEDSFYTAAGTEFDESRTTFAESAATSKDFGMSRTMDFSDTMGFSDTYDSLDMSLSNSKVGGLQLQLLVRPLFSPPSTVELVDFVRAAPPRHQPFAT